MSIPYKIIRSNRKTVAIRVTRDGRVEVRAPFRVPAAEIDGFVLKYQDRLEQQLELVRRQAAARRDFAVRPGGRLLYLGREYPAEAGDGRMVSFDGASFFLPAQAEGGKGATEALTGLYRRLAREHITSRVRELSGETGLMASGIKITGAKTRWGSCSGKNSLSFSWRLILASPGAVDYVILHELCHTAFHDHSPRFWSLVRRYAPETEKWQAELRELSRRLSGENWDTD